MGESRAVLPRHKWLSWTALGIALVGAVTMHLAVGGVTLPLGWAGPVTVAGGALVIAAVVLIAAGSFRKIPAAQPEERPAVPASAAELARETAQEPSTADAVAQAARRGLGLALQLADQAYQQGDREAVASLLDEALEMARPLGDQEVVVAGILNNRGAALDDLGRYEEALADFNRSLELSPGDPATLNNRGNALLHLGRSAEALADYNRAGERFEVAGNRDGMAVVQHNTGLVAAMLEQWPEAKGLLAMALATFRELKMPYAETTQEVLARIESMEGEYLTAETERFLREATITMPAEPVLARR